MGVLSDICDTKIGFEMTVYQQESALVLGVRHVRTVAIKFGHQ